MATQVPNYERVRCGYIISQFKKRQIISVAYFGRTFKTLDEFTHYMATKEITPIMPLEQDSGYVQPKLQLENEQSN